MKPTALSKNNFIELATPPCRGLSLTLSAVEPQRPSPELIAQMMQPEHRLWFACSPHAHGHASRAGESVARSLSAPPNEKEISHGRVAWQAHWWSSCQGPLASSIG